MPKPRKSGYSGKTPSGKDSTDTHDAAESAPQPDGQLSVNGQFKGQIRDVEVGLITGDVTQTNIAGQAAANIAPAGTGGGSQAIGQSTSQANLIVAEGDANLDITVNGQFKGQIRDVEVGLITGDVIQTNIAGQAAANIAPAGTGGGSQAINQSVAQANLLAAVGNVDVSLVINGQFKGQIRDVEVGLITGDVTQTNIAGQAAANIAPAGTGGGSQAINQSVSQVNYLAAIGDIDLTIVFDGNFKGQVRDLRIGLATGDISQTNTSIQVGLNLSGESGKVDQAISQFITQTNVVDANGGIHVILVLDADYKGDFRGIDIDLVIDNILQPGIATTTVPTDAVWT